MTLKKHVLLTVLTGSLVVFWGSSSASPTEAAASDRSRVTSSSTAQISKSYRLDFDADQNFTEESLSLNGQTVKFRAYRHIVYVAHPQNEESQSMNIFIPAAYFDGGTVNGYTRDTAPIFMPNSVGGYMPGKAGEPSENDRMNGGANAALVALSKGYVVAAPAIRGRTTIGDDGKTYVGKAPALIVDYKAAVRYLRYNQKNLPAGDTEKIISNGTSAGGALSALLGATGNAKEYAPYLAEIGAADARDDIFASSDYCPITNLENADMAYEWIFNGVNSYYMAVWQLQDLENRGQNVPGQNERPAGLPPQAVDADAANHPVSSQQEVQMTAQEIAVSNVLKDAFPSYVNRLKLKDKRGGNSPWQRMAQAASVTILPKNTGNLRRMP